MKYYILLLSIIPALSCAMEQDIEIKNRNLDTLQKPHITIINKLPKDANFSTRIDISDKTKIHNKNDYKSDDSTKTIRPDQGIRFSPNLNKTGEPEDKRLGMNDANDAALIALYIHGATRSPYIHLAIGKGAKIQFGESITLGTNPRGAITLNRNDVEFWQFETQQSNDPAHANINAKALLAQFSRPRTTITPQPDIVCPVALVGKEYEDITQLKNELFLEMK